VRKRKNWLLGLVVVLGLFLALVAISNLHWFIPPPQQDLRIEVTGNPGTKIDAAFQADGVTSSQAAIIPATFRFRARRLSFTISQEQDGGELSATVYADERKWATISHHAPGYVSAFIDGVEKDGARTGGTTVGDGPSLGFLDDPDVPGSPRAQARSFWSGLIAWAFLSVVVLIVLRVVVTQLRSIGKAEPVGAPDRGGGK
jgi:hypothetical protein